jgi:hypothetical protein
MGLYRWPANQPLSLSFNKDVNNCVLDWTTGDITPVMPWLGTFSGGEYPFTLYYRLKRSDYAASGASNSSQFSMVVNGYTMQAVNVGGTPTTTSSLQITNSLMTISSKTSTGIRAGDYFVGEFSDKSDFSNILATITAIRSPAVP